MIKYWRAERDWPDDDCFIICGGPSVADCDLAHLQGRRVIAINTSIFTYPSADYLIFADKRWWGKHNARLVGYRGRIVALSPMHPNPRYRLMYRVPAGGLADQPFALAVWHTTVTAAANLAVHHGVRAINFLGLDGCDRDGKSWHHEDHPAEWHQNRRRYQFHGEALVALAEALQRIGVQAYNANPHAEHRMFPHKPFMEMVA